MRTLLEIVEGAKDGKKPTYDECYFAMLALDALRHFDHQEVMQLHVAKKSAKPSLNMRLDLAWPESFNRTKAAFAKDPKDWLGSQLPENPDYQRMRNMAFKVAEKATGVNLRQSDEPSI